MSRTTTSHWVAALSLTLLLFGYPGPLQASEGGPILIVVSAESPLTDISMADLRRAFLGEDVNLNGKRIVPFSQALGSIARVDFDQAVLKLEPEHVGKFWIDRRIRDQSPPPRSVPTETLAIKVAASLPNALTYIAAGSLNNRLKALTIDGHGPSDPNYPLR